MIKLFDSKETNFVHNGICVLDNILTESFITEELNGDFFIEFTAIKDDVKFDEIKGFSIIGADNQYFRIYTPENIQDTGVRKYVTARHIYYDNSTNFVEDVRADNKTVKESLDILLNGTVDNNNFTSGECGDYGTDTAYFIDSNVTKEINEKILTRWGGDLIRKGFEISINEQGSDNGVLVAYNKNIKAFNESPDYTGVRTKLKPKGYNGLKIDIVNGGSSWLESPRINDYHKTFSDMIVYDQIEDATDLKNTVESLWGTIDLPKFTYTVSMVDLRHCDEYTEYKDMEKLDIGDYVIVRHSEFNVDIKMRVTKTKKKYNFATKEFEIVEITLGDLRRDLESYLNETNNEIKNTLDGTKTKVFTNEEEISLQAERVTTVETDTTTIMNENAAHILLNADAIGMKAESAVVNELGETVESHSSALTTLDEKISFEVTELQTDMNSNKDSLEEIRTYMEFDIDGMVIGKTDSPLQVHITNEQMDFLDNGKTVAYVNGQKMYIDTLEVLTSLIVGVHKIEKYSNDITLLRWVGGS